MRGEGVSTLASSEGGIRGGGGEPGSNSSSHGGGGGGGELGLVASVACAAPSRGVPMPGEAHRAGSASARARAGMRASTLRSLYTPCTLLYVGAPLGACFRLGDRSTRKADTGDSGWRAGDRPAAVDADATPIRTGTACGVSAPTGTGVPTGRRALAGGSVTAAGALGDRPARGAWGVSRDWGDWGRTLPGAEKLGVCMGASCCGRHAQSERRGSWRPPGAVSCMALSPLRNR